MKDEKIKIEVPRELIAQIIKENSEYILDSICFNDVLFDYLCENKMPKLIRDSIDRQLNEFWPKDQEIAYSAITIIRKFTTLYELDATEHKSIDNLINYIEANLKKGGTK